MSREERELAAARRRAAKRRRVFEEQVLMPGARPEVAAEKPSLSERLSSLSFAQLMVLGAGWGVLFCAVALWGLPVLGQSARPLVAVPGIALLVAAALVLLKNASRLAWIRRTTLTATCVVLPALLVLGLSSQVVIDGRAYLRSSVTAQSYQMGQDILNDIRILERNQKLLYLDPAQAAGLGDVLVAARTEAAAIAERWNPAVASNAPLPGLVEVMRLTNASATAQGRALEAYEANLVIQDPARGTEVSELAQSSQEFYIDASEELARTLRPLGIDLAQSGES